MKIVLLLLSMIAVQSYAQSTVENFKTISGEPFFPKTYRDVNGTPYLFDDWTLSTITLWSGKTLQNVKINFNLVTDEFLYIDERGNAMVANPTVVKEIQITVSPVRRFVTTPARNTYYEVISTEGKSVLMKHHKKVILETKPYNSATVQRNFITTESFMLAYNGQIEEVKSLKDLYERLAPAENLKEYARKSKLKGRSPESLIRLVDYYNSISVAQ